MKEDLAGFWEFLGRFKQAVQEATLREQHQAVDTYTRLRQTNRGQAERFLSSFFDSKADFQVCLLDEETGEPLTDKAMLDTLVQDMMSRASNDFPAAEKCLLEADLQVSVRRRNGGHACPTSTPRDDAVSFYTEQELDTVLLKCCSSKKCLRGCFSLLTASCLAHRKVILGLANLSRQVGLTSTVLAHSKNGRENREKGSVPPSHLLSFGHDTCH